MTMKEKIGCNTFGIDISTGLELTHEEIYSKIIEVLGGLDVIISYIPFSKAQIIKALKEDRNLNNLSLRAWDAAAGFKIECGKLTGYGWGLWDLLARKGITSVSPAECVCILKEAARKWAIK